MKKCKSLLGFICAMLMLTSVAAINPVNLDNSNNVVSAARRRSHRHIRRHRRVRRHIRRRRRRHAIDRHKLWTGNYRIIGNKRSKIFHIMRGHSYRMNRGNAVFFRSVAAARAAGYRQSKR